MMSSLNLSFTDALKQAQEIRPIILPNPGFMEQLESRSGGVSCEYGWLCLMFVVSL